MSNLDHRTPAKDIKDVITIVKWIQTNWALIQKYWKQVTLVTLVIWTGIQSGIQYYNEHKDEITINKNDFDSAVERSSSLPRPQDNQIISRFRGGSMRAELVVPNSVDVYKLVKIRTDKTANFYDLLVMTVYNGNIVFVDAVPTSTKGEWVFTGPPGSYAVRLSAYDPATGVNVETGNVIIGNAPQPPPGPTKVNVPLLTGLTYPEAKSRLESLGLKIRAQNIEIGKIVWQSPDANSSVDIGSLVIVDTDDKPAPPNVPVFVEKYGFSTLTYNSAMKLPLEARKKYILSIANNFEAVASQIAAGSFDNVNAANVELAGKNRFSFNNVQSEIQTWLPFFQDWQNLATEKNKNGTLPNLLDSYREVFLESAKGLRAIK